MKDAIIIFFATIAIICGAITGVAGGAVAISAVAMIIHNIVD